MLFSTAIMSISTILLAANGILNPQVGGYFKALFKDWVLIALVTLCLIFALSGLNSSNMGDYVFAVRTKLPLLLMPVCLLTFRNISTKQFLFILLSFSYITTIVSIIVAFNAFSHFGSGNIATGGSIETPINHVRYSLIVAFAIMTGAYTLYKDYKYGWVEMVFRIFSICFLIIFLHSIAVRSGLVAFYMLFILTACFYLFKKGKGWMTLLVVSSLVAFSILAFKFVPTLQVKKDYMAYEWYMYNHGQADSSYSNDIGRYRSYMVAVKLLKAHPAFGVGIGDIDDSTIARFKKLYPHAPKEQFFTAHNQYLFVLSAMGWIGGGLFIICLFIPLFLYNNYKSFLFIGFQLIMLMSFIFEAPLQEQTGLTFYWFFTLFIYNYLRRNKYD